MSLRKRSSNNMANSDDEDAVYLQQGETYPLRRISSVDISPDQVDQHISRSKGGKYTVSLFRGYDLAMI